MFHVPMGRFQLEFIYFTYFSTAVPSNSFVFFSCRPFVVNTTFSTGLVGVEVSSVSWQKPTITIISDLNSNCQQPKPGVRRNFNTHKTCWKCINNERHIGKEHTTVVWDDDGGKISKIINKLYFIVHHAQRNLDLTARLS